MWNVSRKKNLYRNDKDAPNCNKEAELNIYECTICEAN